MSDKFVVPLKPVNHFSRLPNQKLVSQFIKDLKQLIQQIEPRCCFVVAQSQIDAFLIVCFCFGKLAFIEQLAKNDQIPKSTIEYFSQSIQKYEWNKMSAFQTFQSNAEQFGKTYPKYFQQILSKYKSDKGQEQVEQMFRKITQNDLLYNVKIRIWDQCKQRGNRYDFYQRIQEQNQNYHTCNLVYLLITIDGQSKAYNVGMVEVKKKIDVRDTIMTVAYQLQPQGAQKQIIQEEIELKKENIIQNTMDLNKKPNLQQKPEKLKRGCNVCQLI